MTFKWTSYKNYDIFHILTPLIYLHVGLSFGTLLVNWTSVPLNNLPINDVISFILIYTYHANKSLDQTRPLSNQPITTLVVWILLYSYPANFNLFRVVGEFGSNKTDFCQDKLMEHHLWNALMVYEPQLELSKRWAPRSHVWSCWWTILWRFWRSWEELQLLMKFIDRFGH